MAAEQDAADGAACCWRTGATCALERGRGRVTECGGRAWRRQTCSLSHRLHHHARYLPACLSVSSATGFGTARATYGRLGLVSRGAGASRNISRCAPRFYSLRIFPVFTLAYAGISRRGRQRVPLNITYYNARRFRLPARTLAAQTTRMALPALLTAASVMRNGISERDGVAISSPRFVTDTLLPAVLSWRQDGKTRLRLLPALHAAPSSLCLQPSRRTACWRTLYGFFDLPASSRRLFLMVCFCLRHSMPLLGGGARLPRVARRHRVRAFSALCLSLTFTSCICRQPSTPYS